MTRPIRFTVRLSEIESKALTQFADNEHLIPSAALRWLIAAGLGFMDERKQGPEPIQK